jgi:large subunit ribosomal protein L19e
MECSPKRVRFEQEALEEIKEAITTSDIKSLIKRKAIVEIPSRGVSRVRARQLQRQKSKGRRRGAGSRKGKASARARPKQEWMSKARLQREFVKMLKEKAIVSPEAFRELYLKIKGGFFRNERHIKLYMEEHGMTKK